MQTKLTLLMMNRDRLMIKKMRLPWYKFGLKRKLGGLIYTYKKDIDLELEKQLLKQ